MCAEAAPSRGPGSTWLVGQIPLGREQRNQANGQSTCRGTPSTAGEDPIGVIDRRFHHHRSARRAPGLKTFRDKERLLKWCSAIRITMVKTVPHCEHMLSRYDSVLMDSPARRRQQRGACGSMANRSRPWSTPPPEQFAATAKGDKLLRELALAGRLIRRARECRSARRDLRTVPADPKPRPEQLRRRVLVENR